ncbi:uncharacterized protein LOC132272395 [Cornus florida]|uniref:uncharacterized protein LOC132272395 n=1 Tax=Cornus florida TaxID=4283 RepID=UPI002896C12D|nr:uncharacterized protein LOC132272395 [Cornus florida]
MNSRQRRLACRQQERLRRRQMGEEQQVPRFQEEDVLVVQNVVKVHYFGGGEDGHTSNQCSELAQRQQNGVLQAERDQLQSNQQRGSFVTFRGTCYTCGEYGHTSKQCPRRGGIGPPQQEGIEPQGG